MSQKVYVCACVVNLKNTGMKEKSESLPLQNYL